MQTGGNFSGSDDESLVGGLVWNGLKPTLHCGTLCPIVLSLGDAPRAATAVMYEAAGQVAGRALAVHAMRHNTLIAGGCENRIPRTPHELNICSVPIYVCRSSLSAYEIENSVGAQFSCPVWTIHFTHGSFGS